MQPPAIPENEDRRLSRLYQMDVLDTPSERLYDDITRLAAMICKTRFATVTLVDRDRQWFKSRQGDLEVAETGREVSFCGHAILQSQVFVVEDTHRDPRFMDNPLVSAGPMIRFYAGAPLVTSDGLAIGTLCVFDPRPGSLEAEQGEALQLLAAQVTERLERRVENTLNRHIGDILDTSELYVLLLDLRKDQVLYTNQALDRRLKSLPGSATTAFGQIFPDVHLQELRSETETEQTLETRVRFGPDDDVTTWVRLISSREEGRQNLLVVINDQSALRASRSEVREARSNLRLFNQAAMQSLNLIVITDATEAITWVNRSFENLTGYSLREVAGKRPGDVLQGPGTSPQARQRLREHIDKGQAVRQEILNYSRHGTPYWLDVYVEPIRDDQGNITHFIASQTNITRRKEQELALREARDAAERANRAKSEFLANISHELRTPLNGILGVAELMQDKAPDSLQPMVQTLNQSSRHLLRLLNDVLDLSHIESGHMSLELAPMNVATELREVAELFRARADEGGTRLHLDTRGLDDLWLMGDATRIKQVVMNLVGNAVKFTEQGDIRIQAFVTETSDRFCTLELAVADNGPGIPEADQQRIFEHFEQLDNSATRAYGGSGLGLAISRQLLRLMGADLELKSEPGRGARFHTRLTLAMAATPGHRGTGGEGLASRHPLREALIVDDNAVNRNILESMLGYLGAERVYAAGSARRGLAMLENVAPELVFVDIQMPTMNGYQFLEQARQRLRESGRGQPLMIACTAHSGSEHRRRSQEYGFDAHLEKPITRDALKSLLISLSYQAAPAGADSPTGPATTAEAIGARATGESTDAGLGPDSAGSILKSAAMRQAFGTDTHLQRQFLELFLQHCPGHMATLSQAVRDGTLTEHSDSAHTLKGLVGYFGIPALSADTAELEESLEANNRTAAEACFGRVKDRIDELLPALRRLLE